MINDFKIKRYWILTFCMVFCSITSIFAQEFTDKEIGFDREVFRKEILSNGIVKTEEIDVYIDNLKKDLILKKKKDIEKNNSPQIIVCGIRYMSS